MTLLTTKEVQDLFKVDKSTIYRMAEDGRIPAVKVGRQWRFPSEHLGDLLGGAATLAPGNFPAAPPTEPRDLAASLPAETAETVAELAGDIFGVMAVVTDMDGHALSGIANQCGLFERVLAQSITPDDCASTWRRLGEQIDLEPRFVRSHLGFLCARSFIRHESSLVGMVIVGGVAPPDWATDEQIEQLVAETGADEATLRRHIDDVYWIDGERQEWIVRNLTRVGDLLSQLAAGRSRLISRLEDIAALAGAAANPAKEPK